MEPSFPRMLDSSSDPQFHAVYWRFATILFYGSKIFNSMAEHILLTNVLEAVELTSREQAS